MQATEKWYTFPFEDTFLESIAPNLIDVLTRQSWVGKLTFLLSALN